MTNAATTALVPAAATDASAQLTVTPAQTVVTLTVDVFVQLVGLAVLAGVLAAVAALCVRWYVREPVPTGLALLVGLSGVAVYLNTTTVLEQMIAGETALSAELEVALFNISAFLAGTGGALTGRHAGDRFATDVVLHERTKHVDSEVSQFVRHVGRVVTVTVPDEIADVVGYDPVPEQTKESLAGESFVFPRNLTVEELRERFIDRIRSDYAVGTVDVELAGDGTVEYLAVGSRPAGIGPTLPPATNAVAVRADPAFAASTGDLVQVWETEPMRRVLTGEMRGVADDVVTLAIDSGDTPKVDPRREYRLVTLPVDDRPEREFASLLRSADQTFSTATVEAGSPLHGLPVGALSLLVIAVEPETGDSVVLPERTHLLAPGDSVAAIGLPEALRRLEAAAEPLDPALLESVATLDPETPRRDAPDTPSRDASETPSRDAPETPPSATTTDSPQQPTAATDESAQPAGTTDAQASVSDTADQARAADERAESSGDGTAADPSEPPLAGQADASTFSELQAELESSETAFESDLDDPTESELGGSEAADETPANFEDDRTETDDDSGLFDDDVAGLDLGDDTESTEPADAGLADLDIDDGGDGDDGDLSELDFDDPDDDLSGLDLDDDWEESDEGTADGDDTDGGDEPSDEDNSEAERDREGGADDEEDTDGETDDGGDGDDSDGGPDDDDGGTEENDGTDDGDDGTDDDSGGGGGSTFAQLKEEFESGDADWEDDISDSPGGDMRLDE